MDKQNGPLHWCKDIVDALVQEVGRRGIGWHLQYIPGTKEVVIVAEMRASQGAGGDPAVVC